MVDGPQQQRGEQERPAAHGWLDGQIAGLRRLRGTDAERAFLLTLGFAALITALHLLNAAVIEGTLFNFSEDWNVPTFASALLYAGAGVLAWRAAGTLGSRAGHGVWLALAAIMLALGVESIADLHTRVEDIGGLQDLVLVLTPVAGFVAVALLRRPILALASPAPLLIIAAAGLVVIAQVVGAFISSVDVTGNPRDLLILVEEGGELLAPCLIAAAATDAALRASAERPPAA